MPVIVRNKGPINITVEYEGVPYPMSIARNTKGGKFINMVNDRIGHPHASPGIELIDKEADRFADPSAGVIIIMVHKVRDPDRDIECNVANNMVAKDFLLPGRTYMVAHLHVGGDSLGGEKRLRPLAR
mmetsp:Transcript_13572/g.38585  ORF Transcript_13572/g.38585 Transcript_13572/m.38585 type:complete len:128 (+) Transcript_13572:53-436(+)|eukprot:CAMPEP_0119123092 /NCGR_PEP_ID=MMETSP1310-20130426/3147_1 /TAXON_ID=464262 /ORGANISM="Genus nov. species nov., Strain RCC2339" /LENGTH=127 /DNA_ID=CAMNT_0007112841 /DNA_START=47 /DNA_END=430 /DNA_ORIENTATION=-